MAEKETEKASDFILSAIVIGLFVGLVSYFFLFVSLLEQTGILFGFLSGIIGAAAGVGFSQIKIFRKIGAAVMWVFALFPF